MNERVTRRGDAERPHLELSERSEFFRCSVAEPQDVSASSSWSDPKWAFLAD